MKDYIHKETYTTVFLGSSFIHSSQNMETIQVAMNRKMNEQIGL